MRFPKYPVALFTISPDWGHGVTVVAFLCS